MSLRGIVLTIAEKDIMTTTLEEEPTIKESPVSGQKEFSQQEVERFIGLNLPEQDRPVAKTTMRNISGRYWRINIWGKKINSECMFGDGEILQSLFIRIDIEDDKMVYIDVSAGRDL